MNLFGKVFPFRLFRVHCLVLTLLCGGIIWAFMSNWTGGEGPEVGNYGLESGGPLFNAASKQACEHPQLEILNPLISKHIKNVGKLECAPEPDWLYLENGKVKVDKAALKSVGPFSCSLSYYKRVDDFSSVVKVKVNYDSASEPPSLLTDFLSVSCQSKTSSKSWDSILAGIKRKQKAIDRANNNKIKNVGGTGLNVLMFGLDSMSRLHYQRQLPKTYSYVKEVLGGVVLEGYNIVGDGTPQALIPILTGFTEPELPETRKRMNNANFVNIYPFAWNNFSDAGYVTAFAEDTPSTGIFTYRLKGFDAPPTDHFMRSFYVEAEKVLRYHQKWCLGSLPRHKVMLNWLKQFFYVYSDLPKFAFGFHGELSHDDYNLVQHADKDIMEFLQDLQNSSQLDNTLLILMSDHGHRFASIRETQQGKQEERLPFFSIIPPKKFRENYPVLWQNLLENEKRLTTPFDIHATLLTILKPNIPLESQRSNGGRSISLFSPVPIKRSCADAGIEPHWCTCLTWDEVPVDLPEVKQAAQSVVDFINEYTSAQSPKCSQLFLDHVTKGERLLPNPAMLKYKRNKDKDGFVADLTDKTKVTEVIYQVQFVVFPSQGLYEASVKHQSPSNTFHVDEREISRINLYGNQPDCVQDKLPNLRKYCYCKTHLV